MSLCINIHSDHHNSQSLSFAAPAFCAMRRAAPSSSDEVTQAAKLMRIRHGLPHVSTSALTAFVRHLHAHPDELAQMPSNRKAWQRARDATLCDTPYGHMLLQVPLAAIPPAKDRDMWIVNPFAYLHTAFKDHGGFYDMFSEALMKTPSSVDRPWRLVLYSDEVVPGNQLSVHNARKVWLIYFSFLELRDHMSNELAWCPIVCEPSLDLKSIAGGISQVFALVIKTFFGLTAFDLRNGSVVLTGPDGQRWRFYASLSMMLQDGGAHKLVWCCKGDAGSRFCMLCKNLVAATSRLAHEDPSNILVSDMLSPRKLQFASDTEIWNAHRRLRHYKSIATNAEFKLRSQAIGYTLADRSILDTDDLEGIAKPASQYCHDWMRGLFAGGVFNVAVLRFVLDVRQVCPNIWNVLRDYVGNWRWPAFTKASPPRLADHFADNRAISHKSAGTFKCPASDGLSLLPVLCCFVQNVIKPIPGVSMEACNAMLALGDLVDALVASKHSLTTPQQVGKCVDALMRACEAARWQEDYIPKFHWCLHFQKSLETWGFLPTCWVHERKHKLVKRYASDIQNTRIYAHSVLSEIVAFQLTAVAEPGAFDTSTGLIDVRPPSKALAASIRACFPHAHEVVCAPTARLPTQTIITKGDVVLVKMAGDECCAASVVACIMRIDGTSMVAVNRWRLHASDTSKRMFATWRRIDEPILVGLDRVLAPVIWCELSSEVVRTLLPFEFQGLRLVDLTN